MLLDCKTGLRFCTERASFVFMSVLRRNLTWLFFACEVVIAVAILFFWLTGRAPDSGHDRLADILALILGFSLLGIAVLTIYLVRFHRRIALTGVITIGLVMWLAHFH
jgi:hypothetical protein